MRRASAVLFAAVISSGVTFPQSVAAQPAEVVSINRNTGDTLSFGVRTTPDGTTTVTNFSVSMLIMRSSAPELPREIENLPEWASDRYDVTLNGPAGSKPSPDTWRNVLAERFKLQAHVEQRHKDGLALVMARADGAIGPNLRLSSANCRLDSPAVIGTPPAAVASPWPTRQEMAGSCGYLAGSGFIVSGGMTMEWLAGTVGGVIEEPFVMDSTGLTGFYAVELDFLPARRSVASTTPNRAEVLTAVEKQLGLTLQPAKVPIPVLVIDHIERPSEN